MNSNQSYCSQDWKPGIFFLIGGQSECKNLYNTYTHNESNVFFPTVLLSCKAQILAASFKEKKGSLDLLEKMYSFGLKVF